MAWYVYETDRDLKKDNFRRSKHANFSLNRFVFKEKKLFF